MKSMLSVGFEEEEVVSIVSILAGVLLIGNIVSHVHILFIICSDKMGVHAIRFHLWDSFTHALYIVISGLMIRGFILDTACSCSSFIASIVTLAGVQRLGRRR